MCFSNYLNVKYKKNNIIDNENQMIICCHGKNNVDLSL